MKTERAVSGMYFRNQNKETGKWENKCFEDLETTEQLIITEKADKEFVAGIATRLADVLNEICEQFDITAIKPEE